ncbi:hypothetical protein MN032_15670 [Agromyces atrinae]|nr:hypothetical protein [Agromyces atrinae]MCI2959129.1 hypothetical protein [Agromyces atrinae]
MTVKQGRNLHDHGQLEQPEPGQEKRATDRGRKLHERLHPKPKTPKKETR